VGRTGTARRTYYSLRWVYRMGDLSGWNWHCLLAKTNVRVCVKASIIKLTRTGPGKHAVWGGVGNTYMSPRNALSRSLDAFPAVHLFLV